MIGVEDLDRSAVRRVSQPPRIATRPSGSSTEFSLPRSTFMSGSACQAGAAAKRSIHSADFIAPLSPAFQFRRVAPVPPAIGTRGA